MHDPVFLLFESRRMVRSSRRQVSFWCWCSKGSLAFQEDPACNPSFLLFFPLFLSPLLPWVTFASNAEPLEVGYFIHLEYKAKVSPADHMPSLHARTRVHAHMVPFVHPRTLDMQQRLTYGICPCMRAYACVSVVYIVWAYVGAYVYGDNVQSNLAWPDSFADLPTYLSKLPPRIVCTVI